MKTQYVALADYNRWANTRLHADAATLSDQALHRDVGVYFGSLFDTLVHLLNTDRAWMFLLQGGALTDLGRPAPPATFDALHAARRTTDDMLITWLGAADEAWFAAPFTFTSALGSFAGKTYAGTHGGALTHVFNHQTHHRGQAHAALTRLGLREPQALDLIVKHFLEQ